MTKLRRFSYRANKRSRRCGTVEDLCVSGWASEDIVELYAAMFLVFRCRISKT